MIGIAIVIKIFLANPIIVGGVSFFKQNVAEPPAPLGLLKTGFQNFGHTFVTMFLRDLYLFLWTLLLIVPGIVKAYSYRMVPYILAENPDMPANEIITRSREMMNGNKWQAFVLDLSFLGWILLGVITLGLGIVFWTGPYIQSTNAALYLKLKGQQVDPARRKAQTEKGARKAPFPCLPARGRRRAFPLAIPADFVYNPSAAGHRPPDHRASERKSPVIQRNIAVASREGVDIHGGLPKRS